MARYALISLGCKVNRTESDGYERLLEGLGFEAADPAEADVIIVNTCTVTAVADKKGRKACSGALRANETAQVWVTGCAAAVDPDQFERLSPRVRVVARAALSAQLTRWADEHGLDTSAPDSPLSLGDRVRPSVKAQDGCDNCCAYCIVPKARGRSRSVAQGQVLEDLRRWAEAGAGEIVLSGINLGAYDDDGRRLSDLLAAALEILPPQTRLRLSSIEPDFITDELIALMASSRGRICRHLHLPLQSGASPVLAAMGRHYTAEFYGDLIDRLREAMPELALSTDIIVGFPGETDEDFAATLALARQCAFSRIHVFPYSVRPGTAAATMEPTVAPETSHDRACRLRRLGDALAARDLQRRVGAHELALVEAPGRWRTESYHLLTGDPALVDAAPGALGDLLIESGLRAL